MKIRYHITGYLLAVMLLPVQEVSAQDLVYTPINPAFGGQTINYSWMLNSANTQNEFKSTRDPFSRQDPLANFEERLQRQVLSQLTRQIVSDRFGDIDLQEKNSFSFGDFNIEVNPGGDGVSIDIFNTMTGDETSVTIPTYYQ